jgi:hypothetical protein
MTFEELRKLNPAWLPSQVDTAETAWIAALASRDEEVRKLVEMLEKEATLLMAWARESREGGWSTHQVDPMRKRTAEILDFLGSYFPQSKVSADARISLDRNHGKM